tara:strand:+ start:291 stop:1445 length:1155 start_codon:yes stop_codon:yes gene_type:complete
MENTDSTPQMESASDTGSISGPESEGISVDALIAGALDKYDDSMEELPESSGKNNDEQSTSKEASEEDAPTTDSVDDDPTDAPPQEASEEGDADQDEETTDSNEVDATKVEAKTKESPLKAPDHWPEVDKSKFDSMPKDAQEWALERYNSMTADYTRKTQEAAQIRRQYQPMDQVLAPVRGQLQANNINEAEYVSRLIEADKMLQQNPVGAIQYLAQQAGVNLDTLEQGEQQYADPQIAALQNRVELLTNHLTSQEQAQAESQTNELYSQIEGFRARQDADGNRLYPHFDSVRQAMGGLIQTGQAQSMVDAYNKAVRLDDGLYKETLVAERKKAESQEDSRRKEAVQKAKKVQSSKGSRPTKGSTQSTDLDDLLGSALNNTSFG